MWSQDHNSQRKFQNRKKCKGALKEKAGREAEGNKTRKRRKEDMKTGRGIMRCMEVKRFYRKREVPSEFISKRYPPPRQGKNKNIRR
jgi:hypothetical protein